MDEFTVSTVANSSTGSGYYYEHGIDYSGETETDCDPIKNVLLLALSFPTVHLKRGVLPRIGIHDKANYGMLFRLL